ncbi:nuclear transport factor 2 family protein [Arthrobacter cavernae]|uniref:Nuclear transport factor 2 family protein n=1 Tax=Arthrobacter cavernae TaxID=2817681 RepID=A0A939KLQ2_9MICC|nr:nuclear transport factor 2 family protein [Arthrobacter cavernae]MBO1267493.1 nuclear transport factor 2 family protein [Arthrobacter cavernae]
MTNIGNAYNPDALSVVECFYGALTARQPAKLLNALHDDFVLTLSPGLPLPGAREHHGREAAVANVWGRIPGYDFALRCEPDRKIVVADNEVLVLGHYRGHGWESPFVHVLTVREGKLATLRQITDTRCWPEPPAGGS